MKKFSTTHYSGTPYQNGAALIVSLMMLVIMTILAVSAVTTTTMQEKMAGNIRNKHLSFQTTEAALRVGENAAQNVTDPSLFTSAGTNGYYSRSDPNDANYPIWDPDDGSTTNWVDSTSIPTGDTGAGEPTKDPQYIIEDFGTDYRDADCALIVPLPPGCELAVYRVTAQGWGLNENAHSMIQSTYKQL